MEQEDLFGDNDDTDHFFLPEHYNATEDNDHGNSFAQLKKPAEDNTGFFDSINARDDESLASSGLGDDDLPEEEQATGPIEDVDYEELIAQGRRNVEIGTDKGQDISMPDFGGLPVAASGAMARWMAGVEPPGHENEEHGQGLSEEPLSKEEILREYYPSFHHNQVLDFTELFSAKIGKFTIPLSRKPKPCFPTRIALEVEADGAAEFDSSGKHNNKLAESRKRGILKCILHDEEALVSHRAKRLEVQGDLDRSDADLILACSNWDDLIDTVPSTLLNSAKEKEMFLPKLRFIDESLDWTQENLYDGILDAQDVKLDLNDPRLLLTEDQRISPSVRSKQATKRSLSRRYNISNDDAYAMLQETHQSKLRSTLTQLHIEHAAYSDRLQSPYYKTILSKAEARAFHRPAMPFKAGQEIKFSRVRSKKKKKDRNRDPKIMLQSTQDISLTDNTGFICLEYSEEYPTILSNSGMGSKIINYYRKRNDEDEHRPKGGYGETHVLGPTDRSPFWNFGSVEPGETTPTLYNKLYRAPIFKHEPPSSDFLLIKTSTKQGNRFFLRNMKHLYTVGQTLPVIDIPGPHSRKVTTSYKNRLRMITYRLVRRNDQGRLMIRDLIKHFPDQNEMQIRQRLKDFMEYQRKGEDQGFWRLKSGDLLPSEESTRAMIDPETVCLIEAMQVGQRHLEDSGYGKSAEADDDQEENMTTEQQLAPWIATRNFINATQGKAMLQLYGEGDPTGRGEGISFIRTSMKGGFKPAGASVNDVLENDKPLPKGAHAYNVAKQQKAYEDEILRIWTAQRTSLSMTNKQVLDDEALQNTYTEFDGASPFTDRSDIAPSPSAASEDDDMMSLNSAMSSSNQNKALRIERLVRDENGNTVTETEIVTDPHVIHAYVTKRRTMDEAELGDDELGPGNDDEKNRRVKLKIEAELAKLKRNQERRRLRKIAKENGTLKTKSKKAAQAQE